MRWGSAAAAIAVGILVLGLGACSSSGGSRGSDASGSTGSDGGVGFDPTGGGTGTVDIVETDTGSADGVDGTDGADGDAATDASDGSETSTDATDGVADATDGATDATDGATGATDATDGVDTTDGDSGDVDEDGIPDDEDNCVFVSNPDQADLDQDLEGDACDADVDGDNVIDELDCDPLNGDVFPGGFEVCDGIDNNCDNITDDDGAEGCTRYYTDGDGDGSGTSESEVCICGAPSESQVLFGGDCDDANAEISPWKVEVCDGVDDNCNLLVDDGCDDDGDGFCDENHVVVGTPEICPLGGGDCLDWSPAVNPNAVEVSANGLDDNCDGVKEGDGTVGAIEPDCTGLPCTGTTTGAMLCALDICYPPGVAGPVTVTSPTGASLTPDAIFGDLPYAAVGRFGSSFNDLAPFAGNSYLAISSGQFSHTGFLTANQVPQTGNDLGGIETSDPFDPLDDMNDAVEVKVTLTAPEGATGFTVDYIFLSAEYEEFIGSSFNDRFYIIMNAPQTTGGADQIINFTNCSDPVAYFDFEQGGQKYCYIAINAAFSEPCSNPVTNISGTGYECFTGSSTGWLVTSWPITGGETFTLTFHIHDTADSSYDSLALIDNFTWLGDAVVDQGTASKN